MKTWLNPKVEVRPSPIEGQGLFAKKSIAKGEQLIRNGEDDYVIMSDHEFWAFTKSAASYDAVALGDGRHRVSTVAREQDPSNFGNHSCDPNAETNDEGLVAMRDIQADEEITCDYALLSSIRWSMACNCGAQNCRKIVRGVVQG
jgi:SET domain-containing protein